MLTSCQLAHLGCETRQTVLIAMSQPTDPHVLLDATSTKLAPVHVGRSQRLHPIACRPGWRYAACSRATLQADCLHCWRRGGGAAWPAARPAQGECNLQGRVWCDL